MSRLVSLLGLEFADMDLDSAATSIAARPAGAPFSFVVTPNADHLVRLGWDAGLREVYDKAALRLLDSRVVARLARMLGLNAPLVAPGSDLTEALLTRHLQPGERVTIIGLSPRWLPGLVSRLGLEPPAHYDPPFGFEHDHAALQNAVGFVRDNPARLVFLAVGSPRQEILAAAIAADGHSTGTGLCIGASLEFLSGARRRAPVWMQRAGLEWLFRLLTEPRRLARRYLIDSPMIVTQLLEQRRRERLYGRAPRA